MAPSEQPSWKRHLAERRIFAGYRFGKTNSEEIRSSGYEHVPGSTQYRLNSQLQKYEAYAPSQPNHFRAVAEATEEYEIVDFAVGRNVGFGVLGRGGSSVVSVGLRHADLQSVSTVTMDGVPNRVKRTPDLQPVFSPTWPPFDHYTTTLESRRGFEGAGPVVEWDAALVLFGDAERGHLDLDWSVGGGVLFGTQEMDSEEARYAQHYASPLNASTVILDDVISRSREDDVTVPTLSLSLGLSYAVDRIKVSTGYSYDRFFGAIDGGASEAKQFDRTIHGPYLKLSVGFGGG